jgi:hypothetical protein
MENLPEEAIMVGSIMMALGALIGFLAIFATVGVGNPYNKWEPDGDKAVLEALENENKEGVK